MKLSVTLLQCFQPTRCIILNFQASFGSQHSLDHLFQINVIPARLLYHTWCRIDSTFNLVTHTQLFIAWITSNTSLFIDTTTTSFSPHNYSINHYSIYELRRQDSRWFRMEKLEAASYVLRVRLDGIVHPPGAGWCRVTIEDIWQPLTQKRFILFSDVEISSTSVVQNTFKASMGNACDKDQGNAEDKKRNNDINNQLKREKAKGQKIKLLLLGEYLSCFVVVVWDLRLIFPLHQRIVAP